MKKMVFACCLVFGLAMGGNAWADISAFNLDAGNPAISGFTGPYATVSINRTDTTHATITFTGLTSGSLFYTLGAVNAADVNVNAASWSIGAFASTPLNAGFSAAVLSDGGAGNVDGWGNFKQTVNGADGFTQSAATISFTLTDITGTWANAASVLTLNSNNALAAAHIFVSDGNATSTARATGFASGNGTSVPPVQTPVPEPSMLLLLGAGLVGLGGVTRRFKRS